MICFLGSYIPLICFGGVASSNTAFFACKKGSHIKPDITKCILTDTPVKFNCKSNLKTLQFFLFLKIFSFLLFFSIFLNFSYAYFEQKKINYKKFNISSPASFPSFSFPYYLSFLFKVDSKLTSSNIFILSSETLPSKATVIQLALFM